MSANDLFQLKGDDMSNLRIANVGVLIMALVLSLFIIDFSFANDCPNQIGSTITGSYTPLPPLNFIEEWDNGLTGNHQWIHHSSGQAPENGYAITDIENIGDGVLVKDNVRYVGKTNYSMNESLFNFYQTPPFTPGLPITPNTYLEFKINDLSINQFPPAPPGYTSSWQSFALNLNSGPGTESIRIEFSKDGQWSGDILPGVKVAYFYVPLGQAASYNIHSILQAANIEIPDPLFLTQIVYNQSLWYLADPSTVEHHQSMEVDYVRVLQKDE
jgi:hypothetical protein